MINMLGALTDKVVSMQEWMDSVSREMEKLRKNKNARDKRCNRNKEYHYWIN